MFENITKIIVSRSIISETFDFLQLYGKNEKEAHAIFAGMKQDEVFKISKVFFPKQDNSGYTYEVNDGEDHKINVQMYDQITAIAQIHTHPANAFHSDIDDEGASLVMPGSFSIPDYGYIKSENTDNWAVYRYSDLKWKWISNYRKRNQYNPFRLWIICLILSI